MRSIIVGLVLLVIGILWCGSLLQRVRKAPERNLTALFLDTLLGFGFEPLFALGCVFGGSLLLITAWSSS